MSSFFGKHLMFSSNAVPTTMGDLRRYEGFFPNMTGATYDPISLLKEDSRNSESRSFLSGSPSNDYGFSNTLYSFSSGEDSVGSSQTSVPLNDAVPIAMKILQQAREKLRTPDKNAEQRISPRKPLKPVKSVNRSDPRFQGVTLRMKTSLWKRKCTQKSPAQLMIDCCFSAKKKRQSEEMEMKTPRRRSCSTSLNPSIFRLNPVEDLSNDAYSAMELELGVSPIHVEKECASCGTYKTPLWRDAEDGTPLCNACGIRYKKYRIRCIRCWYIPKKEEKALPCCTSCGHHFKITLARRGNSFTCE